MCEWKGESRQLTAAWGGAVDSGHENDVLLPLTKIFLASARYCDGQVSYRYRNLL